MAEDNTGSKPASNAPATPEGKPVGEITGAEALAMMKAEKEAKAASGTAKKGDGLNAINSAIVNKAGNKQSDPTEANKEAVSDAAKEASRKLKLKNDDGTEEEIDEAEVLRIYKERKKHQSVASKELNEGRQLRKQTEKFLEMMKDKGSLMDVISKLGHDPRKLAEEYLAAQLADEMLDPKEKELREAKAKLAKIEENERKQREGVEAQRLAELKQKYAKEYETQFVDALKTSGLPANKAMVAEIAKYISRSAKIGYKMTPAEAASLVKEDVTKAQLALYGNADGETLLKLFGDEVAQKILSARGQKVKQPEQGLKKVGQNEQSAKEDRRERGPGTGRMSNRDWQLHKRGLK